MSALPSGMAMSVPETRPWRAAFFWLVLLGPFFFASYGLANWVTSLRSDVGSVVFAWERHIPFLAWTIVPYWSIDLLYVLSLFVCASRRELAAHVRRLLAAQVISVAGFFLFPLRFTFQRPDTGGLFGLLFDVLAGFDKPFNQAPSLHIALLAVLWARYAAHVRGALAWILHAWFLLIGVSVLTTWQHHFIDVPTGLWVGLLCMALFREAEDATPARSLPLTRERLAVALSYTVSATGVAAVARVLGGLGWLLLWPAAALGVVSGLYLLGNPSLLRKTGSGMPSSAVWLLGPYLAGAWVNSRWWTRSRPTPDEVADGVWLGRIPTRAERNAIGARSLVDLTAELPADMDGVVYRSVPMLDLVVPSERQLDAAVEAVESLREHRPTLVFCALGYSRSAMVVAAWLLATGRAGSVEEATAIIRGARPPVVLKDAHRRRLAAWAGARSRA